MAIWLAIVPDGTNRAASLPSSSAVRRSSAVDGRVLAVDVVADLGLGHRPAHRGGGPGDGVGPQVDRWPGHRNASSSTIARVGQATPRAEAAIAPHSTATPGPRETPPSHVRSTGPRLAGRESGVGKKWRRRVAGGDRMGRVRSPAESPQPMTTTLNICRIDCASDDAREAILRAPAAAEPAGATWSARRAGPGRSPRSASR